MIKVPNKIVLVPRAGLDKCKKRLNLLKICLGLLQIAPLFIIDDDEIFFLHVTIIELMGVAKQVLTFPRAPEAVAYLKKLYSHTDNPANGKDLIFLDINIPVMNGFQFLDEYKKLEEIEKSSTVIYMVASITRQVQGYSRCLPGCPGGPDRKTFG